MHPTVEDSVGVGEMMDLRKGEGLAEAMLSVIRLVADENRTIPSAARLKSRRVITIKSPVVLLMILTIRRARARDGARAGAFDDDVLHPESPPGRRARPCPWTHPPGSAARRGVVIDADGATGEGWPPPGMRWRDPRTRSRRPLPARCRLDGGLGD